MKMIRTLQLAASASLILGAATAAAATAAVPVGVPPSAEASMTMLQRSSYSVCYRTRIAYCYPGGPTNPILPEPGSPEEAAFEQCAAEVAAACAALYPGD